MADGFTPQERRNEARAGGARPLRVALFSGNYNYTLDGANKSLNRLVGHLQSETGAQVRVYSPTSDRPAFPPVGELISVPSVVAPGRPDYRLALGLPRAIRRNVEAFQPDIIHLSEPDLLGQGALKLARTLGVPVVASVHTLFDTYLDYYGLGWLQSLLRKRLSAFYSRCDYVLAPTEAMADDLRVEALPARVRIWGRGVDPGLFNPERRSIAFRREHGLDGDRPVIVFLGRIVLEKGIGVFAEAVRRLEQQRGPAQVLVIGDGPAREQFARDLPGAVFAGFMTGERLATALASGDIFLNPSPTETFGNVNLEAMASGLAVVAADAPNTRSILRDGSGLLCDAADPDAFAAALVRLTDDPAALARQRRAALDRSAAYRWPEILQAVADVYDEACGRASGVVTDGGPAGAYAPPRAA